MKHALFLSSFHILLLSGAFPLGADPPAATVPTPATYSGAMTSPKVKLTDLPFAELPPSVKKTVQSNLNGRTVGHVDRVDDDGEISYEIETKAPDGNLGLTLAPDGTLISAETTLNALPASVKAAVTTAVGKGKLNGIARMLDDGETTYVAGIVTNGEEQEFTFDENGTLLNVSVKLTDLPPPVQTAIKTVLGQNDLDGIEKTYDEGAVTYVVGVTSHGRSEDYTFDEDGSLLSVDVELDALSLPLQAAIKAAAGRGQVDGIEKSFDGWEVTYVAAVNNNGQTREFTFEGNGTLVSQEVAVTELPNAVQTAIAANLDAGKVKEAEKTFERGTTTYTADISQNNQDRNLTFKEDGTLVSREVTLAEIPPAVQTTITKAIGSGKITEIDLVFDGQHRYEVEGKKDGQEISFAVGPKGKILGKL